jgi:drug/metabolite transporter (DMT)-like permease
MMKWLVALGLFALGSGPFCLLWWQRLQQKLNPDPEWRDPLNWDGGNHGPWWTGWEEGYLVGNVLVITLVFCGVVIWTIRERIADGHRWPRQGCLCLVLLPLLFLIQLYFYATACD